MKKLLFVSALVAATLSAFSTAHAQESFPEIHNQPIRIHLLNAQDGSPMPHLRVLLVAGYRQEDLKRQLWNADLSSNADGDLQVPLSMLNLPWMQVLVVQAKPCVYTPDAHGLSIESIRQDGLSAPNPCGLAVATEKPGELNFFVQKLPEFKKQTKLQLLTFRKRKLIEHKPESSEPKQLVSPVAE